MALHLIKLCVGVDSVTELESWMTQRGRAAQRRGGQPRHAHVTRMTPKRAESLVGAGSLYWVIAGQIAARQRLLEIEPFVDADGVGRCKLWMDPDVVRVTPRPHRAFQGWRYLDPRDAPPDLSAASAGVAEMPDALRSELAQLGLL